MKRNSPSTNQKGSGSILSLSIIFIFTAILAGIILLFSCLYLKYRAQSTADLAALVAAETLFGFREGHPCEQAEKLISEKSILQECEPRIHDVIITVRFHTFLKMPFTVKARAGFSEPELN